MTPVMPPATMPPEPIDEVICVLEVGPCVRGVLVPMPPPLGVEDDRGGPEDDEGVGAPGRLWPPVPPGWKFCPGIGPPCPGIAPPTGIGRKSSFVIGSLYFLRMKCP
jgi:hypothetical protein